VWDAEIVDEEDGKGKGSKRKSAAGAGGSKKARK
jgi:hypothetical protein